jgi:hypothetical protein
MPTKWVLCAWLLLSVAAPCLASGGEDDWIPVTPQDLQLKEVPGNPGASAVQLYYAHRVDYTNGKGEFFYHRIKILSDAGKKYGDVEVIGLSRTVKDLKARLVRPDGTIIDFKDKPFEKTVVKTRGYKVKAKALTLPEVTVGSIVEYKYWLRGDEYYVYDTEWIIEHDLFTVKEQFSFKYSGNNELVYVTSPGVPRQPSVPKRGVAELELENVPAFRAEEHMPPEENYKMQVRFFFAKERAGRPTGTGRNWGKCWPPRSKCSAATTRKYGKPRPKQWVRKPIRKNGCANFTTGRSKSGTFPMNAHAPKWNKTRTRSRPMRTWPTC